MKKKLFKNALINIDDNPVSDNAKPIRAKRVIITAIAAAFPVIAICIVSLSLALSRAANPVKSNSISREIFPREISVGYDEMSDSNSKEVTSQHIALKCMSFYANGEKIVVDAAMGDEYSCHQRIGGTPSFDTFGSNGYPVFEVCLSDDDINREWGISDEETTDKGKLSINGKLETFEKIFDKEDMTDLDLPDIPGYVCIPEDYHHENIELDFSNFNVGDSGKVIFSFAWFYEHDNPYNQSHPDNSFGGMCKSLYFYIGKNGIAISFGCIEDAKEEYENCQIF